MTRHKLATVAVVGRPNVGKSTFFNRVVGGAGAVVDDVPGVTRDRREAETSWNGIPFVLVDTGGLVPGTRDRMEAAILEQVEIALAASEVILFLTDAREGVTAVDREIAGRLRAHADRVILVANKVESPTQETLALEMTELGFGNPWAISGQHGRQIGDLLDDVVARIPGREGKPKDVPPIRFTLVGRPNVGKSSLANRLLGEPRLIVHPEAGTTRDAIDVPFRFDGDDFVLVDTAGLRRPSRVTPGIEYYSVLRTQKSLERSDVALLVLDACDLIGGQDARIAQMIQDAGKSTVFVVNKWDLIEKTTQSTVNFTRRIHEELPQLTEVPILFVSALTGLRVRTIPPLVRELHRERHLRVATHDLNEILEAAVGAKQPPVRQDGKPTKLFYATQTGEAPPTFAIFTNSPRSIPAAYAGYLRNTIRQSLGIRAAPIRLVFRGRR